MTDLEDAKESYPHLSKAPIVEAVIDFRVKLASNFDLEAFKPLRAQLEGKYPRSDAQQIIQQTFKQEVNEPPEFSTRLSGIHSYRLHSEDGKNIVQLRRDGFAFSRLNPYTTWEEVFEEAWELWKMYVATAAPMELSRVGVRYINRLLLPGTDLSKYLEAGPVLADGWPTDIGTFLSRVVLLEGEIVVNVVQALEPATDPGQPVFPMIFDIDASQTISLSPGDVTIHDRFVKLREMKNRIFFKGLTAQGLKLFL